MNGIASRSKWISGRSLNSPLYLPCLVHNIKCSLNTHNSRNPYPISSVLVTGMAVLMLHIVLQSFSPIDLDSAPAARLQSSCLFAIHRPCHGYPGNSAGHIASKCPRMLEVFHRLILDRYPTDRRSPTFRPVLGHFRFSEPRGSLSRSHHSLRQRRSEPKRLCLHPYGLRILARFPLILLGHGSAKTGYPEPFGRAR